MDRRRTLLIAAALVAALGTALVFVYVRGADNRAQERFTTVPVLTASALIAPGETIDDAKVNGKLVESQVPADLLMPNAQTTTDLLAGQVALTSIYPGEQIVTEKFGVTAAAQTALQIPTDMMAMSVNLTDPARVAGFVNPGSEVAVFVNGTQQPTGEPFTRILLTRVTVLGVGSTTPTTTTTTDQTGASTTEQLPRTLLTLALAQQDVEKVNYAQQNGDLTFALLTPDSKVDAGPPVTFSNLFG